MTTSITSNLYNTIAPLFGRTPEDAELAAVLGPLGELPFQGLASDEFSRYVTKKADGFCFLFEDAETVRHPVAQGKARKTPVFTGCFFYPDGVDEYSQFTGSLPEGILWTDTAATLLSKLGTPKNEILNKKTGRVKAHRWNKGNLLLTASYKADASSLHHLYIGIV
jgi:hypothetical protein